MLFCMPNDLYQKQRETRQNTENQRKIVCGQPIVCHGIKNVCSLQTHAYCWYFVLCIIRKFKQKESACWRSYSRGMLSAEAVPEGAAASAVSWALIYRRMAS